MGQLGGIWEVIKRLKEKQDILGPDSLWVCEFTDHTSLVLAPSEDLYSLIRE